MPSTRSGKAAAKLVPPSRVQKRPDASIQQFTRTSKLAAQEQLQTAKETLLNSPHSSNKPSSALRKRKASDEAEALSAPAPKRLHVTDKPRSSASNAQSLPTPDTTPVSTRSYQIGSPILPIKCSLTSGSPDDCTQRPESSASADIPVEISDLPRLNSALLRALALSCAHAGSNTPVDIRLLTPSATRIYGKRKVTADDVRRCLQLMNSSQDKPVFELYHYGQNKVCVERCHEQKKSTVIPRWIDERALTEAVEAKLVEQWQSFVKAPPALANTEEPEQSLEDAFISQLPLAAITVASSLKKLEPRMERSQRRLEDLKGAAANTQQSTSKTSSIDREAKTLTGVQSRASSLLARLQARSENAPAHVEWSPEQKSTVAALQRLETIIPILTTAGAKCKGLRASIPMTQIVRTIRESAGRPWGAEEVEASLTALAHKVGIEGWISISRIGGEAGTKCVTIEAKRKPIDIKSRVEQTLQEAKRTSL